MTSGLVKFWKKCDLSSAPYFHPEDKDALFRKSGALVVQNRIKAYKDYISCSEFSCFDATKFHLPLLPIPYGGDIKRAEVVILFLNPGLSHTDYYGELERPDYRQALEDNLRQDFSKTEFPFLWLNPDFCWHGGFVYWEKKFRGVLKIIAEKKCKGSYLKALRDLSQKVAMIELVPYHSAKFNGQGLIKNLPSAQAAIKHVQDELLPATRSGKKTLIVLRQKKAWGIKDIRKNVIVYNGSEAVGSHLTPKSRGGRAILGHYKLL